MKLHLTTSENQNLITGYGENFIEVNKTRYAQSLIVLANQLNLEWKVMDFSTLTSDDFNAIIDMNPEVLLLGTGTKHQFLHPKLSQNLIAKNIPVECMTTAAACRTYNILMSEGRNVAAALIL